MTATDLAGKSALVTGASGSIGGAIARALAGTGYSGFVGHEFVPTAEDPFTSLAEATQCWTL